MLRNRGTRLRFCPAEPRLLQTNKRCQDKNTNKEMSHAGTNESNNVGENVC